jgi:anti-sigma factor RsiW
MNCREFTEFLGEYLSGDLSEEERSIFEWHLAECPECRAYLETYRMTLRAEKATFHASEISPPPVEAPDDLIRAILRARSRRS